MEPTEKYKYTLQRRRYVTATWEVILSTVQSTCLVFQSNPQQKSTAFNVETATLCEEGLSTDPRVVAIGTVVVVLVVALEVFNLIVVQVDGNQGKLYYLSSQLLHRA